ncbi:endonuclease [Saccharomonospora piscinae]|uniref:Endonuclease n=1 Tax=Saccharomonospora piscinae TaxID=687388 RepID=A0A1V9A599_SACPI|nr:endonuclease [Saccharomonospora piscinae]OQO92220.1 endonuclease [Saccharomonospora piscinae]
MSGRQDAGGTAEQVLDVAGRTYADEAGITLADSPSALYRLLVLSVLLSARIKSDIAVAAAKELFRAGYRTPERMLAASWQDRVDALGRGHYVRYDESTASTLEQGARVVADTYGGDLRRMAKQADGDVARLRRLLREVPGLGPVGADIFCREAQAVWPWLRPFLDRKAREGAERAGLPTDVSTLSSLVRGDDLARFSAALVRVRLDRRLAERLS